MSNEQQRRDIELLARTWLSVCFWTQTYTQPRLFLGGEWTKIALSGGTRRYQRIVIVADTGDVYVRDGNKMRHIPGVTVDVAADPPTWHYEAVEESLAALDAVVSWNDDPPWGVAVGCNEAGRPVVVLKESSAEYWGGDEWGWLPAPHAPVEAACRAWCEERDGAPPPPDIDTTKLAALKARGYPTAPLPEPELHSACNDDGDYMAQCAGYTRTSDVNGMQHAAYLAATRVNNPPTPPRPPRPRDVQDWLLSPLLGGREE